MRQWAVITGAAGGIGQALVAEFRRNGYKVIATDQAPQPEDLVCERYLQADLVKTVNDVAYAEQVFKQIKQWLHGDGLHALINNAAVQILGGVESLTLQDWQTTLNVNLVAPFLLVQALLPELEQNHGSVVNISSIHAKLTKKNFIAYATSKAALSGMTKAMAVNLGGRIRINAIEPAAIETKMLLEGFKNNKKKYEELKKMHPINNIGDVAQVAKLVTTIASGDLSFLHGACVPLDGGISAKLVDPD